MTKSGTLTNEPWATSSFWDQISKALGYARALPDPTQRRLPDALTAAVGRAIQAGEQDQPETARAHLGQAVELAQEMGYL